MHMMDDIRFHPLVCRYADLVSLTLSPLSDLDQFDENENILHRADEQESANTLSVSDHFTRLVWIDPNSPTLQRKGVAEETAREEDDDEPEDEREQEEEDARTAYEMDNASEEEGKQSSFPEVGGILIASKSKLEQRPFCPPIRTQLLRAPRYLEFKIISVEFSLQWYPISFFELFFVSPEGSK